MKTLNKKNLLLSIFGLILIIVGAWIYSIVSYEEDLGTKNEFIAKDSITNLTSNSNNSLFNLSFSKSEEPLEWSKLRISIDNGNERMDCSKGNFTSNDIGKAKVSPKLSSDGVTFSVMIDATSENDFTHLDLSNLMESDSSNFNLKFSTTDIYLSENTTENYY